MIFSTENFSALLEKNHEIDQVCRQCTAIRESPIVSMVVWRFIDKPLTKTTLGGIGTLYLSWTGERSTSAAAFQSARHQMNIGKRTCGHYGSVWLLHPIGDKLPPSTCNCSGAASTQSRCCYLGGLNSCLSCSPSLTVSYSTQSSTLDVARSAPQG